MELFLEKLAVNNAMTHLVEEGIILFCSGPLWVSEKWLWVPHPGLILDGAEDMVGKDLERSETNLHFVGLRRVPWGWLIDCTRSSGLVFLQESSRDFNFFPSLPYFGGRLAVL